MAQFHEASGHCTTDGARYSEITEFERAVSQRQALSADGNESFGDELDWLGKRIVPTVVALSEAVPHGLIHADFVPHNLLVVDGMLVAILDLDEAYAASLVRDLADFMRYFPLRPQTIEEDVVTLEALVEGYEQVRHLTSMERRLLPYSWLLSLFSGAVRRLTRRVAQGRSPRWEDAASRGYGPVKDYLISQGLVDTAAG
jgi:Ser/Thr protein kinase RdoA (MazF antagonist)